MLAEKLPGNLDIAAFRTILLYGLLLAGAAFALNWLEYQYLLRRYPIEAYLVLLAIAFMSLGIWVGYRVTTQRSATPFERNDAALMSLGISGRELEVLELLAKGRSNKEVARDLGISPNTVKTHVAHIFEKLDVDRRLLAIEKARALQLIA